MNPMTSPDVDAARSAAEPGRGAPEPAVVLDVWADVVCPWCYLAKRRLRRAIDGWERPHEVLVRHRAYELDPRMPKGRPVPVNTYLGEKYGGGEEAGARMSARAAAIGEQEGLRFDMAHAVKANSYDAHRLIALAREMGGPALEDAALERMYSAHFAEGLVIDDHDTLLRCAAEAGMDERRVASVLADDTYGDHVRGDEEEAQSLGVRGVPFVVANGRVAVSGAQPIEVFLELLRVAAQPPEGTPTSATS
jgi:predicted DsbA family dithiol-disulfide isomerase